MQPIVTLDWADDELPPATYTRTKERASGELPELESILAGIEAGTVKAFYIHLAEGRSDNARSRGEFDRFAELGAVTERTVIIHGTALSGDQLGELKGRWRQADLVAAVEPAPLRRDDRGGRGARAWSARRASAPTGCPRAALAWSPS